MVVSTIISSDESMTGESPGMSLIELKTRDGVSNIFVLVAFQPLVCQGLVNFNSAECKRYSHATIGKKTVEDGL